MKRTVLFLIGLSMGQLELSPPAIAFLPRSHSSANLLKTERVR